MEIMKSKNVCTLCTDSIISPITLACTHVFCKECAEKQLKFHYNGSATVVCPMNCEQQSRIPNDATASCLVTDIRTYIGSDTCTTSADSRILCHWKTCDRKMTRFCVTCNVTFCRKCWDRHLVQCLNTAPYLPVGYNYRKGEISVICSVHQTSADYVCLNCDYKFICVYCKHRSHKGHFVEHALQSSICLKRSNIRRLFEEKERVGMNVSEYHFGTVKECEEKLKLELMKRKLKCFRDYSYFIDMEEEKILADFRNQMSSLERGEINTSGNVYQGSHNCATYSKLSSYDIRITNPDLHSLGTMTMNIDNRTDPFIEDPTLISFYLNETEIDLKFTNDLCKKLESLTVKVGEGGDQTIGSVEDTLLKPDTRFSDISSRGSSCANVECGEQSIGSQCDNCLNNAREYVKLNDSKEHGEDNRCNAIGDPNEVPEVASKVDSMLLERVDNNLENNTQLTLEAENASLQEVKTNINHVPDNDKVDEIVDLVGGSEVSQVTSVELNSVSPSIGDTNGNFDLGERNQLNSDIMILSHDQTRSSNDKNPHLKLRLGTTVQNRTKSNMTPDHGNKNILNPDAVPVFFPSKTTGSLSSKSSPSLDGQSILNPKAAPVFYPKMKAQHGEEEMVPDSTTSTDPSLARFLAAASAYSINTNQFSESDTNENLPPETPLPTDPTFELFLEQAKASSIGTSPSQEKEVDMVSFPYSISDSSLAVFLKRARKIQWRSPEEK